MAHPFLVKLTQLEPDEIEWVQQLVTISSYVDEYLHENEKWSNRLLELKRKQAE